MVSRVGMATLCIEKLVGKGMRCGVLFSLTGAIVESRKCQRGQKGRWWRRRRRADELGLRSTVWILVTDHSQLVAAVSLLLVSATHFGRPEAWRVNKYRVPNVQLHWRRGQWLKVPQGCASRASRGNVQRYVLCPDSLTITCTPYRLRKQRPEQLFSALEDCQIIGGG